MRNDIREYSTISNQLKNEKNMAEIYQIPDNNGNAPQFTIPIGGMGNGGFGFGNGMNGIVDLFGLAIIASIFGWNNGVSLSCRP